MGKICMFTSQNRELLLLTSPFRLQTITIVRLIYHASPECQFETIL